MKLPGNLIYSTSIKQAFVFALALFMFGGTGCNYARSLSSTEAKEEPKKYFVEDRLGWRKRTW